MALYYKFMFFRFRLFDFSIMSLLSWRHSTIIIFFEKLHKNINNCSHPIHRAFFWRIKSFASVMFQLNSFLKICPFQNVSFIAFSCFHFDFWLKVSLRNSSGRKMASNFKHKSRRKIIFHLLILRVKSMRYGIDFIRPRVINWSWNVCLCVGCAHHPLSDLHLYVITGVGWMDRVVVKSCCFCCCFCCHQV